MNIINHIHNGIYISGIDPLYEQDTVRNLGIEAIVRLDTVDRDRRQWDSDFKVLDLPFPDVTPIPPEYIPLTTNFIHEYVQENKKVLVHCHMGISRSVTMVMAYLHEFEHMSLPDALNLIDKSRKEAYPSEILLESLVAYYELDQDIESIYASF